jgi:putative nucleotide binding protein
MERYVYVLDFLPAGRSTDRGYHREPVALAVGETELKLLEILPKPGVELAPGNRVAVVPVDGVAPPIDHVRRRLAYDELTTSARSELGPALEAIVRADPTRYLRFFNDSPSVSRRFHLLELLPGIGKKTMLAIVEERRRGPFASFADLEARLHLKNPERLLVGRIEAELQGVDDKYRLFVAP